MAGLFTDEEIALFAHLPETDLIDLAIELDVVVGEVVSRPELLNALISPLADLAKSEGLPFSRFDKDDLDELPREHLVALARTLNLPPDSGAIVKAGERIYKRYRSQRSRSQVPLFLPTLLPILARHLSERDRQGG